MQILATDLALSAGRGPVYGPLSFELDTGLNVLRGDAGSGRTSLLLTLAGRMKPDAGSLTVGGYELPRKLRTVQKFSAVAGFNGIDQLEESVTVAAALRERQAWISPWYARVSRLNDVEVAQLCAPVFGREVIPHANTVIWDLSDVQTFLLRLTLATLGAPRLLLVDDLEQIRSSESRATVWDRLAALADDGTHVVVSASSLDERLWAELGISPHVVDMTAASAARAVEPDPETADDAEYPEEITALHELIEETL